MDDDSPLGVVTLSSESGDIDGGTGDFYALGNVRSERVRFQLPLVFRRFSFQVCDAHFLHEFVMVSGVPPVVFRLERDMLFYSVEHYLNLRSPISLKPQKILSYA